MIYFVRSGDYVKIGFSDKPQDRIKNLQTANPGKLSVLGVINGSRENEADLHKAFSKYRIGSGEWFRISDEIILHIEKNCRPALWGYKEEILVTHKITKVRDDLYIMVDTLIFAFAFSIFAVCVFSPISEPSVDNSILGFASLGFVYSLKFLIQVVWLSLKKPIEVVK